MWQRVGFYCSSLNQFPCGAEVEENRALQLFCEKSSATEGLGMNDRKREVEMQY